MTEVRRNVTGRAARVRTTPKPADDVTPESATRGRAAAAAAATTADRPAGRRRGQPGPGPRAGARGEEAAAKKAAAKKAPAKKAPAKKAAAEAVGDHGPGHEGAGQEGDRHEGPGEEAPPSKKASTLPQDEARPAPETEGAGTAELTSTDRDPVSTTNAP